MVWFWFFFPKKIDLNMVQNFTYHVGSLCYLWEGALNLNIFIYFLNNINATKFLLLQNNFQTQFLEILSVIIAYQIVNNCFVMIYSQQTIP